MDNKTMTGLVDRIYTDPSPIRLVGNDTWAWHENRKWSFTLKPIDSIDWKLILSDLTSKNPIALVDDGKHKYVCVHTSLKKKAALVGMYNPEELSRGGLNGNEVYVVNSLAPWIEWAKAVKTAPWPGKKPYRVTVALPTI